MRKVMFVYRPNHTLDAFAQVLSIIMKTGHFDEITITPAFGDDDCVAGRYAWKKFKTSNSNILVLGEHITLDKYTYPHIVFTGRENLDDLILNLKYASVGK